MHPRSPLGRWEGGRTVLQSKPLYSFISAWPSSSIKTRLIYKWLRQRRLPVPEVRKYPDCRISPARRAGVSNPRSFETTKTSILRDIIILP